MNTDTAEIKKWTDLTENEKADPEWVPVSDEVVRVVKLGQSVEVRRAKRKAQKLARRKNRSK